jgi:hypothetical protein
MVYNVELHLLDFLPKGAKKGILPQQVKYRHLFLNLHRQR